MHGNYVIGVHKYLATAYHTNGEIKLCQKCDNIATFYKVQSGQENKT